MAMLIVCVSSFIRTIPSVSEFHRLGKQIACSWTFTTGGEFHSAPKTTVNYIIILMFDLSILNKICICNAQFLKQTFIILIYIDNELFIPYNKINIL